jgi:hypothetical protein
MLRSANDLKDFSIGATDGEIGRVEEFYFDDKQWTVRYIVVNTGGWFNVRKVLISPYAVDGTDWNGRTIETALTREEVMESPRIDVNNPVSRDDEAAYNGHHNFPHYWAGPKLWGPVQRPGEIKTHNQGELPSSEAAQDRSSESHLRSTKEMHGYVIDCTDGNIGHVEDFILDDESWVIRYLVIDTRNWWPGKKVTLPPRWIENVNWPDAKIHVDLSRRQIKDSPEYDDTAAIDREYEERLHRHYGQAGYWETGGERDAG